MNYYNFDNFDLPNKSINSPCISRMESSSESHIFEKLALLQDVQGQAWRKSLLPFVRTPNGRETNKKFKKRA